MRSTRRSTTLASRGEKGIITAYDNCYTFLASARPVKRLLLQPDWGADPLWDYESGTTVRLESLPVSTTARQVVRAWRDAWEALASRQARADDIAAGMAEGRYEPPSRAEWRANDAEMQRVWRILAAELGDGWRIAIAEDRAGQRYVKWSPEAPFEEVHEPAGRRFWDGRG